MKSLTVSHPFYTVPNCSGIREKTVSRSKISLTPSENHSVLHTNSENLLASWLLSYLLPRASYYVCSWAQSPTKPLILQICHLYLSFALLTRMKINLRKTDMSISKDQQGLDQQAFEGPILHSNFQPFQMHLPFSILICYRHFCSSWNLISVVGLWL